jgi:hypothetical protein
LAKLDVPEIFLRAPWVSKPCDETELLTAVLRAMHGHSAEIEGFAALSRP